MLKIILDTNVLVSGLISFTSSPAQILDLIADDKIKVHLSNEILYEYKTVINRDKFKKYDNFYTYGRFVIVYLEQNGVFFEPRQNVDLIKDPDDNKFLELALEAKSDYLITGNTDDFRIKSFSITKIVSPKEFIDIYNESILLP
mgnify:CR=1 FL=1